MAQLTFSAFGLHYSFALGSKRLFGIPGWPNSSEAANFNTYITGGSVGAASIDIFQGTVPAVDTLVQYSDVSANLLVSLDQLSGQFNEDDSKNLDSMSKRYFVAKTSLSAVANSGTATWFMMRRKSLAAGGPNTDNFLTNPILIGSVGILGSGADMELPFINLTAGESFKCGGVRINIPCNWEL